MPATGPTDDLAERPLAPSDAERAVALSEEAGWNQTAADWRFMLRLGEGRGLWTRDGRLVASALTLPYGNRFAWIGMVLVTAAFRRRGLATRFLAECIESAKARGLDVGLDATEAGRPVYRPLGFSAVYGLHRIAASTVRPAERSAAGDSGRGATVRPLLREDLEAVAAYDAKSFGADRFAVLDHLRQRQPGRAFVAERRGHLSGHVLARDGRVALHLGPLVAEDDPTAIALVDRALAGIEGQVFIDLADRHTTLRNWLAARGFAPQRPFTRMILRHPAPLDEPARIFAIAGPELG